MRKAGKTREFVLSVLLSLFFLSVAVWLVADAHAGQVVASNYSDRYHEPTCKIVEKITPEEKVTFGSPEEAQGAGYGPCKKCHPLAKVTNLKTK